MPTTQAQTIAPHWEESTVQDPVSQKWKKWSMCLYCKKKFSSLKPDKKCAHTGKVPKHGICPCHDGGLPVCKAWSLPDPHLAVPFVADRAVKPVEPGLDLAAAMPW